MNTLTCLLRTSDSGVKLLWYGLATTTTVTVRLEAIEFKQSAVEDIKGRCVGELNSKSTKAVHHDAPAKHLLQACFFFSVDF